MTAARTPLLASDRVRVYLTLVPYLLERGQVSLAEAASDFGVTETQMRGMVEKLTVIGLPGDSGYWQPPQELFDIDWDLLDQQDVIEITNGVALRRVPRFSAREASALLAGLQLVASVPAVADSGLVAGLIGKLSRGAADAPADVVVVPGAVDEVRSLVSQALRDQVAVRFRYQAPDSPETVRTVDPVQVLITDGQWYLQGWCHLRQAMRTFHLDRVSAAELTGIPSVPHEHPSAEAFTPDESAQAVAVRLPAALAPLLAGLVPLEDETTDGDVATVRMRMADPRTIKRIAARFAGRIEVQAPGAARRATRDWAAAGLALYPQPDDQPGL